jgi:hypothetical protein
LRTLAAFIELSEPLESAKAKLQMFPWDYDGVGLRMTRVHMANILRRFLAGEIGADVIVDWADTLEVRPDLDYAPQDHDWLTDRLFELANPSINGNLTRERAIKLLDEAEA